MAITPRPIVTAYEDTVYNFIKREEKLVRRIYSDPLGIPTLGVGYALFRFNNATGAWERRPTLNADLAAIGITLVGDSTDDRLLNTLLRNLNAGNGASNFTLVDRASGPYVNDEEPVATSATLNDFSFSILNDPQARTLYDLSITRARTDLQAQFTKHLTRLAATDSTITNPGVAASTMFASLDRSNEMLALSSMAFNAPGLIGPNLTAALYYGDRAEAWYNIRYDSNKGGSHANRRYREAEQFALYNDINSVTDDDAKAAYRTFTRHAEDIQFYEGSYPPDFANNAFPGLPPTHQISTELESARSWLISNYIDLEGIGISVDWDHIQVGEDQSTLYFKNTDTDVLTGSTSSDLIFGESGMDTLKGGGGQDVIYGGEGNDVLEGGAETDYLFGGNGRDTYIYDGQGNDVIEDADGLGRIVYRTPDGTTHVLAGGLQESAGSNTYVSPDGRFRYERAGDELLIRSTEFSGVLTVQHFTDNSLHIALAPATVTTAVLTGTGAPERLQGGSDSDLIQGNGDPGDIVIGKDGNDRLFAAGVIDPAAAINTTAAGTALRGDWLTGGLGNDTVVGADGNDILFGGGGDLDLLIGGAGDDVIAGDDDFVANSFAWTTQVLPNPFDTFFPDITIVDGSATGIGGADILYGGSGNDKLAGLLGDDYLDGGANDDWLSGGSGSDVLLGGVGSDKLTGEFFGGDRGTAFYQPGDDYLDGGAGDDDLWGEEGNDQLFGGADKDILYGDIGELDRALHGNDYLNGGTGDDKLFGMGGDDVLLGGADNDWLQGGDGLGNDGNDALYGEAGNDTLLGEDGSDYLSGGDDIDTLIGGAGADVLDGGKGNDIIWVQNKTDRIIYRPGDGYDQIYTVLPNVNPLDADPGIGLFSIENLGLDGLQVAQTTGPDGTPWLTLAFNDSDSISIQQGFLDRGQTFQFGGEELGLRDLMQYASSVSVEGGSQDDTIYGGSGDDYLQGWAGNDILDGQSGNDTLHGSAGSDTYIFGRGYGADVIADYDYPFGYTDTLRFGEGIAVNDLDVTVDSTNVYIRIKGTEDRLTIYDWNDWDERSRIEQVELANGTAIDLMALAVMPGTTDRDYLFSGDGNDVLFGRGGNDDIKSAAGDDILAGGAGNDDLRGGLGNDIYLFNPGDGYDSIQDGSVAGFGGIDTISFGGGIRPEDIDVYLDYSSGGWGHYGELMLSVRSTGEEIWSVWTESGWDINDQEYLIDRRLDQVQFLGGGDDRIFDLKELVEARLNELKAAGDTGTPIPLFTPEALQAFDLTGQMGFAGGQSAVNYALTGEVYDVASDAAPVLIQPIADQAIEQYNSFRYQLPTATFSDPDTGDALRYYAKSLPSWLMFDAETLTFSGTPTAPGTFNISVIAADTLDLISQDTFTIAVAPYDGVMTGTDSNDSVTGTPVADTLYGLAGDDQLSSGNDSDVLDGGTGADDMRGGAGDDTYIVDNAGDTVVESANAGLDTVRSAISFTLGQNVENLVLTGADNLSGTGNSLDNTLTGNDAVNVINGAGGSDSLYGAGESDTLAGDTGDDRLFGGDGNDSLDGGDGGDMLSGDLGDDSLIGGNGNDTLSAGEGNDTLQGGTGSDQLVGGVGDDAYFFALGDGADVITDPQGHDRIVFGDGITIDNLNLTQYLSDDGHYYLRIGYGTGGDSIAIQDGVLGRIESYEFADGAILNHGQLMQRYDLPLEANGSNEADTLYGTGNADTLLGFGGNDDLLGNGGNDTLDGGTGDDALAGGTGVDTYILRWGMGSDSITDADGANLLRLDTGIGFNDLSARRQGDDLHVYFRGLDQGALVKDYYLTSQDWTIQTDTGVSKPLSDFVAESYPDSTATIGSVMSQYEIQIRAAYFAFLGSSGFSLGNDGVWRKDEQTVGANFRADYHYANTYVIAAQITDSQDIARLSETHSSNWISSDSYQSTMPVYVAAPGSQDLSSLLGAEFFPVGATIGIPFSGISAEILVIEGVSPLELGGAQKELGTWVIPEGYTVPSSAPRRSFRYETAQINSTLTLEIIEAGSSNNTISTSGYSIVDAGAGDDHILAGNFYVDNYAPADGYSPANIGPLLYGGAGNDTIIGSSYSYWYYIGNDDLLIGGAGNDFIDGREGADTYLILAGDIGVDVIMDTGQPLWEAVGYDMSLPFYSWYYESLGISNWESQVANNIENLPGAPLIALNDYQGWEFMFQSGLIRRDTVEFGEGIHLPDLQLSWGEYLPSQDVDFGGSARFDASTRALATLDISWGPNQAVRIVIPPSLMFMADKPAEWADTNWPFFMGGYGWGIEQFKFSDGSIMTMLDLLRLAPSAQTFDPFNVDSVHIGTDLSEELYGAAGNDILNGAGGNDIVLGGSGGDVLNGGDGYDYLSGGSGNDYLDGSFGTDVLVGGEGDDIYVVDDAGDVLNVPFFDGYADGFIGYLGSTLADPGTDTVMSYVSYVLGDDLENLELVGNAHEASGNSLNNVLTGNTSDNLLQGFDGDDILAGGSGNDLLFGGAGNDSYVFNLGDGQDTITEGHIPNSNPPPGPTGPLGLPRFGLPTLGSGEGGVLPTTNYGINSLRFGASIGLQDLQAQQDGGDLLIHIGALGDSIRLVDFNADISRVVELLEFVDGSTASILDILLSVPTPTGGDDVLAYGDQADIIDTLAGNDTVNAGAGSDSIAGGTGNDVLAGEAGDDTYIFNRGDGVDTIDDLALANEGNTIQLGTGIDPAALTLSFDGNVLVISLGGEDQLRLTNFDPNDVYGNHAVETFQFADGTVLSYSQLIDRGFDLVGTAGDDVIQGTNGVDRIVGGDGNDTIIGGGGNDIIDGGTGNDTLYGGTGDDTYVFDAGNGTDTIYDNTGEANTLIFGTGVDPASVTLNLGSLFLNLGNGEGVHLEGFDPNNAENTGIIGTFTFGDGTILSYSDLLARGFDIVGTDGDDFLAGTSVTDRVTGGLGNDTINGGAGNDTYYYNLGDGSDTIADTAGADSLVLGSGIALDGLHTVLAGDDLMVGSGADTYFTIAGWGTYPGNRIESFVFADGAIRDVVFMESWGYAPVLQTAIADMATDEDSPFAYDPNVNFLDQDGNDTLTYSATLEDGSALPGWLSLDGATGLLTGTPLNEDVGTLTLRVTATDTVGRSVSDAFTLTAINVNDAPVLANAVPDQMATEGNAFSYTLASDTFHDDDAIHGDALSYAATQADSSDLPSWLTFDPTTQTFTGTSPVDSTLIGTDGDDVLVDSDTGISGAWDIKVTATDTSGISAEDVFTLTLQGVAGNDTLKGGRGNDVLNGGGGDDTYIYSLGDGLDQLTDYAGQDTVRFGTGFSFENTVIRTSDGVARLRFLDDCGCETEEGMNITLNADSSSPIESFTFADGTSHTLTDLLITSQTWYGGKHADTLITGRHDDTIYAGKGGDTVYASTGNDTLYGEKGKDRLYGEGGNDALYGDKGSDYLDGGCGDDYLDGGKGHNTLIGGEGNDTLILGEDGENTILFGLGDGRDTLKTSTKDEGHDSRDGGGRAASGTAAGDNDIHFGAGITPDQLWFERAANDLRISILGTQDGMTIEGWYSNKHRPIEEIRTANGYELEDKKIELLVQAMAAFSPVPGSGNVLPTEMPESLQPVLAAAWET